MFPSGPEVSSEYRKEYIRNQNQVLLSDSNPFDSRLMEERACLRLP